MSSLSGEFLSVPDLQCGLIDEFELADEPRINLGGREDLLFGGAAPQGTLNLQIAMFGRHLDGFEQLFDLFGGCLSPSQLKPI